MLRKRKPQKEQKKKTSNSGMRKQTTDWILMDALLNPFTPTFGKIPPILAGRKLLIQELEQVLASSGAHRR